LYWFGPIPDSSSWWEEEVHASDVALGIDVLLRALLTIPGLSEVTMLLMLPSDTIGSVLFVLAVGVAIAGVIAFRRRLLRHRP
jgi:hypothetical protein